MNQTTFPPQPQSAPATRPSPSQARSGPPLALPTKSAQAKSRSPWKPLTRLGLAVVLLLLAAWGVQRWWFPAAKPVNEILAQVTRADLPIIVTERGQLESARTETSKCQVEGENSKIVFLLPEGTLVKKGTVVVRFDADKIRRGVAEQEIKFKTADGKAKAAKEELDVQKNKGASEIAKAELAYDLAVLDKKKYLEGEYKVEVDDKKGAIKLAERELKEAEEKLEGFRTFVRKGFGTPEQLTLKELEVARAKNNLERDRAKLMVLETFTLRRQEVELTAKEKEAKRELARTDSTAKANIAKAETDYETSLSVAKLEKEQLERSRKQLDHIDIKAPQDGIVIYEQARYWDPASRVQIGGLVTYQQPIFQLPDLDFMQVKMKIHESKIKKVKVGQKAEIRVEALPGLVLHGTVIKVAMLANSEDAWRGGGTKEFETILKIDNLPSGGGLKPGFSVEVSIEVNHLPNVLAAPIQAVAQRDGKHFAYVLNNNVVERREITVGENNEKFVEIKSGLEESEAVCLDARARTAAEAQAGEREGKSNPDRK